MWIPQKVATNPSLKASNLLLLTLQRPLCATSFIWSSRTFFTFKNHNIHRKLKNIPVHLLVSRFHIIFTNASSSQEYITVIVPGLHTNLQKKHPSDISTKAPNRNTNIILRKRNQQKSHLNKQPKSKELPKG